MMGSMSSSPDDRTWKDYEVEIALDVARPTRIADFVDGGASHFAVDREVTEQLIATVPGGIEGFKVVSQAAQVFLERVVHHLVTEAGTRQFLVTGCKVSGEPNVHDIAQAIAPESRVVYLVLDPVSLAHAHKLKSRTPEGVTAYVQAKLRDTEDALRQAAKTLDLSEPVGVLLPASLSFVRRAATAYHITSGLMAGVPSGSHLMITHHASDLFVEEHRAMYRLYERLDAEGKTWGVAPRSYAEVAKFFDGMDLVEPGIVPVDEWRASTGERAFHRGAIWAALARKP
jgi:hypothetical protein